VAFRGSGHTPSKTHPNYWNGNIKWLSLKDTFRLDQGEVVETADSISEDGLKNSSAVLHPSGSVVLLRDAGIGKGGILGMEAAVSQHFMVWRCGRSLYNWYLYYLFQSWKPAFDRVSNGSTIKTIGLDFFRNLAIPLPQYDEQVAMAHALRDIDGYLVALEKLIAKKQAIQHGMMQELLTGRTRLPGFAEPWRKLHLRDAGVTYGGLAGKTKADFDEGSAQFVTFMEVMSSPLLQGQHLGLVNVPPGERQNTVQRGDVLFNGSSETPEEVALAAVVDFDPNPCTYLNSFCFGYRLRGSDLIDATYLAYFIRSGSGRAMVATLAQGATRYNISKTKLLDKHLLLPPVDEQRSIVSMLRDAEDSISATDRQLVKAQEIKNGMVQQLLTGRMRLPEAESAA